MKLAIFGRTISKETESLIQSIFDFFEAQKTEMIFYKNYMPVLNEHHIQTHSNKYFTNHIDLISLKPDFLISIGGDGTLLHTVSFIRDSEIPVIGINTGRVGFLTGINKDELCTALQDFINGLYKIEPRLLMHLETNCEVYKDLNFALNEISLHRDEKTSMIGIRVKVNGEDLNTFWGDGLIIATPSGSTAYSLSCGGPILMPQSPCWVLTPVATHNLTVRPLVIPANSGLDISVESRSSHFYLGLDARIELVKNTSSIHITKEIFHFNTVHFKHQSFGDLIREKLLWAYDKRNS